jgi:uncharacterized membrane protein YkvA (DUF1232 family)
MSAVYKLNITEKVKSHFHTILTQSYTEDESSMINKVELFLANFNASDYETYVQDHVVVLENMLKMLKDRNWTLSSAGRKYILSALKYFVDNDDVIPDDTPVVGLLDDCIVIDIVNEKVNDELKSFNDFDESAKVYTCNDERYTVNDWHETQKMELNSRLRHRRNRRSRNHGTRGTSFSI